MRKSEFSDEQIIRALRRLEDGKPTGNLYRACSCVSWRYSSAKR